MNSLEKYITLKVIDKNPGLQRRDIAISANLSNPCDVKVYHYYIDTLLKTGMIYKYNSIQYDLTRLGKQELKSLSDSIKNISWGK